MQLDQFSRNFDRKSLASLLAEVIYRITGSVRGKVARKFLRGLMRALPDQLSDETTNLICQEYRFKAGTQPTNYELNRLAYLCGIFPLDVNLATLAFRVNLYPDTNEFIIEQILTRFKDGMIVRADIALMYMFYLHKTRPENFSAYRFLVVDFDKISYDLVLIDIWRVLFVACLFGKSDIYPLLNDEVIGNYLKIETDPNTLYSALYALFAYYNKNDSLDVLSRMISSQKFLFSIENFALTFFFLVSYGLVLDAIALERSHKELDGAYLHPMYIKSKFGPVNTVVEGATSAPAFTVDPGYSSRNWLWRDAELQKFEIQLRLTSPSLRRHSSVEKIERIHLLVAIFGQMRHPEITLAGVRNWVLNDFSSLREQIDITFAVSTWRETGTKVFLPDDHIDTVAGFFTTKMIDLLRNLGCCTISDIANYCPRVVQKIFAPASLNSEIDNAYLANFFPGNFYSAIGDQNEYMASLGGIIVDEFEGNQMIVNQGRMINRLSAFKQILHDISDRQSRPTHVLFIRPDLCDLTGSLAARFSQMRHDTNWVVVDEDAYAHAVEGVGDRYILADNCAADFIVEIERYTKDILGSEPPVRNLRKKRLEPHQMLRSLFFEHSVDVRVVSRRDVGWNLYRGDLSSATIANELSKDVAMIADEQLKQRFLSLM